jgi:hypothetical protein
MKRSYRDCNRCMVLAAAAKPEDTAAVEREKTRTAMRRSRAGTNVGLLHAPAKWQSHPLIYRGASPAQQLVLRWFAGLSRVKQQFLALIVRASLAAKHGPIGFRSWWLDKPSRQMRMR